MGSIGVLLFICSFSVILLANGWALAGAYNNETENATYFYKKWAEYVEEFQEDSFLAKLFISFYCWIPNTIAICSFMLCKAKKS